MKNYKFQALSTNGQKINGVIPANNKEQVLKYLKSKQLQLIRLQLQKIPKVSGAWAIEWSKDVGFFLKQGLSLLEGLEVSKLRLNTSQKYLVDFIIEGLYAGTPLSKILQGHFPQLFIGLLQVAEATGQYAQAFEDYAELRSQEQKFYQQLHSSLRYPILLVIVILTMVIGFSEFLLPTAMAFFKSNNLEQRLATMLFIQFASGLKRVLSFFMDWQTCAGVIIACCCFFKIPKAKYYLGWFAVKIPFFGSIYLQILQSLYLKSFATLLSRGHQVLLATKYSGEILHNQYLKHQVTYINNAIQQTGKISVSIAKFLKLPKPLTNLLQTGEKTAQLVVYSEICAKSLKNQASDRLDTVLIWTAPFLISTMGIVMIWMVVAVVLPLYDQIARMD